MKHGGYTLAVVGATGLVGGEITAVLAERQFPLGALQLYASLESAGDEVRCGSVAARIEVLDRARFTDVDITFLAADQQVSAEWAERATAAGSVVVDMTQLFVADPAVPLVVPEVNAAAVADYETRRIVASPDAAAVALAVALQPLHQHAGITRIVASTYEPVSSSGRAGIEELQAQTIALLNGRSVEPYRFRHRIAFNTLPQMGEFLAGGSSVGEAHTRTALARLLEPPVSEISITRVCLPVFFGTALCVNVETRIQVSAEEACGLLRAAPGVWLRDDVAHNEYPTAIDAVGQDATCVGRVRAAPGGQVLDLWVAIDNVRKGAAVNAVQIAELLIRDYL